MVQRSCVYRLPNLLADNFRGGEASIFQNGDEFVSTGSKQYVRTTEAVDTDPCDLTRDLVAHLAA